jgi:hypothetical protein
MLASKLDCLAVISARNLREGLMRYSFIASRSRARSFSAACEAALSLADSRRAERELTASR